MTNKQIIGVLYEISELLELKNENRFKIRAYQKLAQFLEGYDKELSDVYKEKEKKGLVEIPHIGEGIAKKIIELLDTGKLDYLDELKSSLPAGLETFLKIPNMGPKTAVTIVETFKIKTVAELEKMLKEHKLKDVKGFGEKTEEKLLKGIELYKKGQERKLLGEAYPIAEKIIESLKKNRSITKISIAGSLRRMEETIGDIDILAVAGDAKSAMETFCTMEIVKDVIAKGETKSSVNTVFGIQADLRVVADESYGAAMQYFTGNKSHNVMTREIAVKKGYKLNEYGLFSASGKKNYGCRTEEEIYEKFGLQYIPPELRAGGSEIEAAQKRQIPVLVEQSDIKGDLHVHSNHSDGVDGIEALADGAKKAGYKYIAITDHSAALVIARGLDKKRIFDELREIEAYNKKENGLYIFKGAEVDILEDGTLDHPDEVLSELDIVIGSVHRKFNMTKKDMTDRLLAAMDNKYLNIIGHISGRMINQREPYEVDYEKIFDRAAKAGIAIEVNSQPVRLDMKDIYIREAVRRGVKLAVNTDAHSVDQFRFMLYGAGIARRGWAKKEDIINTLPLQKLIEWIEKRRQ
jgi:DNA polymerase (family X)